MAVAPELQVMDPLHIEGEWLPPARDESLEVVDQATDEPLGHIRPARRRTSIAR